MVRVVRFEATYMYNANAYTVTKREKALEKKSLGRLKNPQEIPSCNSQLPGPHTNAQLPGPRTIYQLLFVQIISNYQLSFVKSRTIYQ